MLRRPGNRPQEVKLTIKVVYAPHPNLAKDVTLGQRNGAPTERMFGKRRKTGKRDSEEEQ